jgi:hypothetical protein
MSAEYVLNQSIASTFTREPASHLFRHRELLCCIQRNMMFGTLNGYVAIGNDHPFHRKSCNSKVLVPDIRKIDFNGDYIGLLITAMSKETELNMIRIGMYLQAHGGVNYSADHCPNIDKDIFSGLWWFGFDTCHAGDLHPIELNFGGRSFDFADSGYTYKDYGYVARVTRKLADQLADLQPARSPLEDAAYNYYCKQH